MPKRKGQLDDSSRHLLRSHDGVELKRLWPFPSIPARNYPRVTNWSSPFEVPAPPFILPLLPHVKKVWASKKKTDMDVFFYSTFHGNRTFSTTY